MEETGPGSAPSTGAAEVTVPVVTPRPAGRVAPTPEAGIPLPDAPPELPPAAEEDGDGFGDGEVLPATTRVSMLDAPSTPEELVWAATVKE